MNWRKRLQQWAAAIKRERGEGQPIPWLKMLRGILTPVPRAVWRERLRYGCYRCPMLDKVIKKEGDRTVVVTITCRSVHPALLGMGCGCYVVFKALSPEPYEHGCWGRAKFSGTFGWGAYKFPSRLAVILSFPRFLLRR